MQQIKFDIAFRDKILAGEKDITIRDEQKLQKGEEFEIVFIKDGEIVQEDKSILAKCIESYQLILMTTAKDLNKEHENYKLVEICMSQPMVVASAQGKELTFRIFDSSSLGFATFEEAYDYYKENNLLENSYFLEFELKEEQQ
jgi:uncharacterized protein YqfB (UPF0267 family)